MGTAHVGPKWFGSTPIACTGWRYRLSGNRADAEDLTQETFVRVFKSLAEYTPGTFEGWLHRITANLFLDMVQTPSSIRFDALPDDAR